MEPIAADEAEFWRDLLGGGGFDPIPRWVAPSRHGEHHTEVPAGLVAGLRRTATELRLPVSALVLAAHAAVLSALTGEDQVTTGYLPAGGGTALPVRLPVPEDTWRRLAESVHAVEAAVLAHRDTPVAALRGRLGLTGPLFETVLDPVGDRPWPDGLAAGVVLSVRFEPDADGGPRLLLRYRTDVADPGYAARIAGYHLTALSRIAAAPDTPHRAPGLLSAAELAQQLDGLAGPVRERPDRRAHELFEERARAHPDAIAAVHGTDTLTYRELDRRANRIGRALLALGVGREDVVAVVTERNLDWMAAVLAVFKAGACYLPVEPHFPAGRVTAMLSRAGCRLAVTEHAAAPGVVAEVAAALPALAVLGLDTVPRAGEGPGAGDDGPLGIEVTADQLAYLYFTSGSTGEPKGALCEHAGMLNHLYAKAEDLGIGPGTVVAQTAPQCFDISLWQLVCGPLCGGTTVIVEQDVVLDAERFLDRLTEARVNVVQVVPSYLDVLLSSLERNPRALPDLRHVVVTGEEVRRELVRRWFDAQPGIGLVNAYGLTETSDDTNHEVMREVPDTARVPLGPVIPNARVCVVDENLDPVPLGAPGEIVFSGVCVGRGYVNDPERTRAAFTTDPHHPGQRLYRSGDQGRWLPDGKLEFLGRGDSQVKIRGFRIELGEIENRLLGLPGVRAAAAVVAGHAGGGRRLVAFYLADAPRPAEELRAELGRHLPEYMVPAALHHRDALPLTANGKVDKKALTALAVELGDREPATAAACAPETPAQRRLAVAWSEVLRVPVEQIGRDDHFFDRGGTSLSAVRLAIALDRLVSPKDMATHPVLADLAELVEVRAQQGREPERQP